MLQLTYCYSFQSIHLKFFLWINVQWTKRPGISLQTDWIVPKHMVITVCRIANSHHSSNFAIQEEKTYFFKKVQLKLEWIVHNKIPICDIALEYCLCLWFITIYQIVVAYSLLFVIRCHSIFLNTYFSLYFSLIYSFVENWLILFIKHSHISKD